ncbi:GNAT family N-acetyltransferase [Actinosynnema pretiosum subsp. pretiosum]|uniref:GNAT family N-acetyltransferase n=1 Tax=Actinosynnema pretiosum subsp. pretiosum TaxID=103721 RepID=A0AA45R514_9PSEU|nr:Lead, cadmium, zinc and mercury transporting ATPase [Actinosynnema pretiosum subsp. pretiosum]QUF05359.1 GNAT family N-acetyltransferase [Actinosynnema pretiosum subsp. pretiosum]
MLLRPARPEDVDQIAELLADRGDPEDAVDFRLVARDPEAGSCAVVVDKGRVVSTATLLDETLVLGDVVIPTGQVELVATAHGHEGRGLVRRLMSWAHEHSAERGHLAQVMIGIPYFYRRFGYSYAIPIPATRALTGAPDPGGHVLRPATPADVDLLARLHAAELALADLRMPHPPARWRWLLEHASSGQWVVELAGEPVAVGRVADGVLVEAAATTPEAAHALAALTGVTQVVERPGTVAGRALEGFLAPADAQARSYYARVPDAAALLERLRPVLSRRLAAAGFTDGEAVVSFFSSHVRLPFRDGVVDPVVPGGVMQGPASVGGSGVAPDLLPALLFGPHGITGLAERHPDVYPGPRAELAAALFPPVRADLMTYYVP